jgi:hypothetical protein
MTALKKAAGLEPGKIYYDFNSVEEVPGGPIPVTGITFSGGTTTINLTDAGQTEKLTAVIEPPNATLATQQRIYWFSDDEGVATVDNTGTVTAVRPGTANIYVVAGDKYAKVHVTNKTPITIDTIGEWTDTDSFKLAGATGSGYGTPSGVIPEVVSFDNYGNVLKLVPPNGIYPPNNPNPAGGGSMILTYQVPYSGTYTFSMDIFFAQGASNVELIFYNCSDWKEPFRENYVGYTGNWKTVEFTWQLIAGDVIGILGNNGTSGLRDATVYIKDFMVELDFVDQPLIDIPSTAEALP